MKIVYVARHGQVDSNDDEGAVTHALEALGHEVVKVNEGSCQAGGRKANGLPRGDFLLFHKWANTSCLRKADMPRVFWYFDLVNYPQDRSLETRDKSRIHWMNVVLPLADLGFCTDGDWVRGVTLQGDAAEANKHKLVWLTQGCDERVTGFGRATAQRARVPILFTGIRANGGRDRAAFVDAMSARWGDKFHYVQSGTYRRKLADLIAQSDIVVGPTSPVTDYYWSNRVYNSLGMGAFMLHADALGLHNHYEDGEELVYYRDLADLHELINYYLAKPDVRANIARRALDRSLTHHTYRRRCELLVHTVKERLKL